MTFHTNRQIIRGSFQLSSQTDRNQTKWLSFLIDAAKQRGLRPRESGRRDCAVTYLRPPIECRPLRKCQTATVPRPSSPSGGGRNASNGKTFKTDGPSDPEVMAAERISITSSIRSIRKWPFVLLRKPCKCTFPAMTSIKPHRRIASQPRKDRRTGGDGAQGWTKEWTPGWQFALFCLLHQMTYLLCRN